MKKKSLAYTTALVIVGIMISYILQMGPSALLLTLRAEFALYGRDAQLNMCVSIIFPFLILGSITGGYLEQRIGTRRLFSLTMAFLTLGLVGNFWVRGYVSFLIFRSLFGLGFGLGVPFIGSAIMKWYTPAQRDSMTTLNGLFPFVATLIAFCSLLPLSRLFGGSWRAALGSWGVVSGAVLALWFFTAPEPNTSPESLIPDDCPDTGLYAGLLKRKPILYLTFIFVCDFFCYAYIATILPTWLFEVGTLSETTANVLSAVAFPFVGLLGCGLGGLYSASTGRRKPPLVIGQGPEAGRFDRYGVHRASVADRAGYLPVCLRKRHVDAVHVQHADTVGEHDAYARCRVIRLDIGLWLCRWVYFARHRRLADRYNCARQYQCRYGGTRVRSKMEHLYIRSS